MKYQDYLLGTKEILQKSQSQKRSYFVKVLGKKFIVYPNVFSPKYFFDTGIFARHLPIKKDDKLLEIGPGTGVISITAVYRGARKVVAIDLNPAAVMNTQENVSRHSMTDKIDVRLGDLYKPLRRSEKFSMIFWNTPFGMIPKRRRLKVLERAIFDPGYVATKKFIMESPRHLKKNGRLVIGFSSTLGKVGLIKKFCHKAGMSFSLLYEESSHEKHPVKFELFEARLLKKPMNRQATNS